MDGEVDIQDGKACVSCHQVPSGIWSQAAVSKTLPGILLDDFSDLLDDAIADVSGPDTGRPAMWSQLMIAATLLPPETSNVLREAAQTWKDEMLQSQQDDGLWLAKGQFPSQRRPTRESNEVITMWMIRGLKGTLAAQNGEVADAVEKATQAIVGAQDGISTEWIALRLAMQLEMAPTGKDDYLEMLVSRQQPDGSWGWDTESAGDAYSTGVALFALSHLPDAPQRVQLAQRKAVEFLLAEQGTDGSWAPPSALFTKRPSESRDYVYNYWATAWAAIGLSAQTPAIPYSPDSVSASAGLLSPAGGGGEVRTTALNPARQ